MKTKPTTDIVGILLLTGAVIAIFYFGYFVYSLGTF